LAERLVRLIRDPALCRRMGEAGRRAYQNRFTLDGHLDQMETLYRQVIHERGGARP
jgi:glycosyltransferase involved in cell wall biosynthesis